MPRQANDLTVVVQHDGVASVLTLRPREFSTGSSGYMLFGRIMDSQGRIFQTMGNSVLVGSKAAPSAKVKGAVTAKL